MTEVFVITDIMFFNVMHLQNFVDRKLPVAYYNF